MAIKQKIFADVGSSIIHTPEIVRTVRKIKKTVPVQDFSNNLPPVEIYTILNDFLVEKKKVNKLAETVLAFPRGGADLQPGTLNQPGPLNALLNPVKRVGGWIFHNAEKTTLEALKKRDMAQKVEKTDALLNRTINESAGMSLDDLLGIIQNRLVPITLGILSLIVFEKQTGATTKIADLLDEIRFRFTLLFFKETTRIKLITERVISQKNKLRDRNLLKQKEIQAQLAKKRELKKLESSSGGLDGQQLSFANIISFWKNLLNNMPTSDLVIYLLAILLFVRYFQNILTIFTSLFDSIASIFGFSSNSKDTLSASLREMSTGIDKVLGRFTNIFGKTLKKLEVNYNVLRGVDKTLATCQSNLAVKTSEYLNLSNTAKITSSELQAAHTWIESVPVVFKNYGIDVQNYVQQLRKNPNLNLDAPQVPEVVFAKKKMGM